MSALAGAALLAGLAAGGAVLLALALLAALPLRVPAGAVRGAGMALAGAGSAAALAYLALGAPSVRLASPFLVAGVAPELALDGLSGFGLLALLPVALAWLAVAAAVPAALAVTGASVLAVLAADAGSLAMAVLAGGLAAAAPLRARGLAWWVAFAVPALGVALADGGLRFAWVRAQAAADGMAGPMLALVLAAGAGLAALPPAHRWPRRDGGAGLAGPVLATVGLVLLVRAMLDLAGPLAAGWAAAPLLAGAAGAVLGGVGAVRAAGLRGVQAGLTACRSGLVALGLGLAVAGRAVDDGPAAALALGAALVLMAVLGWAQALWGLVAQGVARGAGTEALGRLGGLAHRMRFSMAGALAAGLAVAMLPPGAGFAGWWLLLRAAALLPRGGGAEWWGLAGLAAVALGVAGALLAVAVLRAVGVAFLGRPRAPRAAVADEVAPGLRWAMLGFCALLAAAGLVPGLVLALAAPAVGFLAGAAPPGGVLAVAGYAPLGIALLLALAAVAVALLVRLVAPAGHRVAPAWEGGAPPPPAWLPFGDPATQAGAAGFAAGLPWPGFGRGRRWRRAPGWRGQGEAAARWASALPRRAGPVLVLLVLAALLALHEAAPW